MADMTLTPPFTETMIRNLHAGDRVTLQGTLYGIRDATLIHLFDRDRRTRFDLSGQAVIHTAPNVSRVPVGPAHPAGYAPVSVGTTTSQRMERFTRPLLQRSGVRAIVGKSGLGADSLAAFRIFGAVYLAMVGGAAALETTWIERIDDVDLDDLNPESLWKFAVRDFGPLLVTMDTHGNDLHEAVRARARRNRTAVLAGLGLAS